MPLPGYISDHAKEDTRSTFFFIFFNGYSLQALSGNIAVIIYFTDINGSLNTPTVKFNGFPAVIRVDPGLIPEIITILRYFHFYFQLFIVTDQSICFYMVFKYNDTAFLQNSGKMLQHSFAGILFPAPWHLLYLLFS